jgi:hypothetical protein
MVVFKGGGRVEPGPIFLWDPLTLASLRNPAVQVLNQIGSGWSGGVAGAGANSIWTWEYMPYRIEEWTVGGVASRALDRRPSWFPHADVPMMSSVRNQLPPPHLQGVQQDSEGRIWVFANVPVTVWAASDPVSPSSQMEKYFRTRIEVIDPTAERVIASVLLDAWVVSPLPGGRAAVYGTTPQGTPYVSIVQLTLVP